MNVFLLIFSLLFAPALLAADIEENPALAEVFAKAGVQGTFVLYDVSAQRLSGFNVQRAGTRYIPASTFKIAHTLIGLSTGAVSSVDEVFPYNGKPLYLKAWEHDMGLREAIKVSNLSVYQALARRIGLTRMQGTLARLDYGNGEVGDHVDQFWIAGPLKISAVEQARFLARLALGQLPLPAALQASTREISLLEQGPGWRLYGKTGWADKPSPDIGWWVGWVEQEGKVYTFALNIDMPAGIADAPLRIPLGKACLRAYGLLQVDQ